MLVNYTTVAVTYSLAAVEQSLLKISRSHCKGDVSSTTVTASSCYSVISTLVQSSDYLVGSIKDFYLNSVIVLKGKTFTHNICQNITVKRELVSRNGLIRAEVLRKSTYNRGFYFIIDSITKTVVGILFAVTSAVSNLLVVLGNLIKNLSGELDCISSVRPTCLFGVIRQCKHRVCYSLNACWEVYSSYIVDTLWKIRELLSITIVGLVVTNRSREVSVLQGIKRIEKSLCRLVLSGICCSILSVVVPLVKVTTLFDCCNDFALLSVSTTSD